MFLSLELLIQVMNKKLYFTTLTLMFIPKNIFNAIKRLLKLFFTYFIFYACDIVITLLMRDIANFNALFKAFYFIFGCICIDHKNKSLI